jgi:hypothetical protein
MPRGRDAAASDIVEVVDKVENGKVGWIIGSLETGLVG